MRATLAFTIGVVFSTWTIRPAHWNHEQHRWYWETPQAMTGQVTFEVVCFPLFYFWSIFGVKSTREDDEIGYRENKSDEIGRGVRHDSRLMWGRWPPKRTSFSVDAIIIGENQRAGVSSEFGAPNGTTDTPSLPMFRRGVDVSWVAVGDMGGTDSTTAATDSIIIGPLKPTKWIRNAFSQFLNTINSGQIVTAIATTLFPSTTTRPRLLQDGASSAISTDTNNNNNIYMSTTRRDDPDDEESAPHTNFDFVLADTSQDADVTNVREIKFLKRTALLLLHIVQMLPVEGDAQVPWLVGCLLRLMTAKEHGLALGKNNSEWHTITGVQPDHYERAASADLACSPPSEASPYTCHMVRDSSAPTPFCLPSPIAALPGVASSFSVIITHPVDFVSCLVRQVTPTDELCCCATPRGNWTLSSSVLSLDADPPPSVPPQYHLGFIPHGQIADQVKYPPISHLNTHHDFGTSNLVTQYSLGHSSRHNMEGGSIENHSPHDDQQYLDTFTPDVRLRRRRTTNNLRQPKKHDYPYYSGWLRNAIVEPNNRGFSTAPTASSDPPTNVSADRSSNHQGSGQNLITRDSATSYRGAPPRSKRSARQQQASDVAGFTIDDGHTPEMRRSLQFCFDPMKQAAVTLCAADPASIGMPFDSRRHHCFSSNRINRRHCLSFPNNDTVRENLFNFRIPDLVVAGTLLHFLALVLS